MMNAPTHGSAPCSVLRTAALRADRFQRPRGRSFLPSCRGSRRCRPKTTLPAACFFRPYPCAGETLQHYPT